MKHTEIITIPAHTREDVTHTTCDLCGRKCGASGKYDVDDVVISRDTGYRYPEWGDVTRFEFDCCGSCFAARISPLFPRKAREVDLGY